VDLFVRDTGGRLPAMLCLHGMEGRGENFGGLIARYRDRFRVIAPDQRGHGLSGRPVARYAAEDFAEDAHRLLRRLRATPAIVVAHSLSGRFAPVLAARYPDAVRGVVLLDPAPGDGPERPAAVSPAGIPDQDPMTKDWPLPFPSRDEALRFLGERFPGPAYPGFFAESLVETVAGYDFLWSGRAMAAIHAYQQDTNRFLPQVRCPVLLVRATRTRVCTPERAAQVRERLRDCTFVEVEGGHIIHQENAEATFRALDDWLARL
jgi:2-succinyl-6-hydroxy-2,4-cyclohexadiene-1-carboxylate synthase